MHRIKQMDIEMENTVGFFLVFFSKMSLPTFPLYVLLLDKDPLCAVRPLNQAALFTLPTVKTTRRGQCHSLQLCGCHIAIRSERAFLGEALGGPSTCADVEQGDSGGVAVWGGGGVAHQMNYEAFGQ